MSCHQLDIFFSDVSCWIQKIHKTHVHTYTGASINTSQQQSSRWLVDAFSCPPAERVSLLQPRCDPLRRLGLTLTVINPLTSTKIWRPSLNKLLGWTTPYQIRSTIRLNGYSCSSSNFWGRSYIGMSVSILGGSWVCWWADFGPYTGMCIHIPQYSSNLILRTYINKLSYIRSWEQVFTFLNSCNWCCTPELPAEQSRRPSPNFQLSSWKLPTRDSVP